MPTVADYEDAVRRIVEADVPDDATTTDDVIRALAAHGGPQVNARDENGDSVAENIARAILTEDKVIGGVESGGELPTEDEIDAIARAFDDYDMSDRVDAVSSEVRNSVATVEDVESAVSQRQAQKGSDPTFREDVEAAVDSVASRKQFVGESPDEVASDQAHELGAPSRNAYETARVQLATGDSQITPADVLDDPTSIEGVGEKTANSPATLIRDETGDPVALMGAPSREAGEQMARELGADYTSYEEINSEIGLDQRRGEAALTLRGRRVAEVDVE